MKYSFLYIVYVSNCKYIYYMNIYYNIKMLQIIFNNCIYLIKLMLKMVLNKFN